MTKELYNRSKNELEARFYPHKELLTVFGIEIPKKFEKVGNPLRGRVLNKLATILWNINKCAIKCDSNGTSNGMGLRWFNIRSDSGKRRPGIGYELKKGKDLFATEVGRKLSSNLRSDERTIEAFTALSNAPYLPEPDRKSGQKLQEIVELSLDAKLDRLHRSKILKDVRRDLKLLQGE